MTGFQSMLELFSCFVVPHGNAVHMSCGQVLCWSIANMSVNIPFGAEYNFATTCDIALVPYGVIFLPQS